MPRLFFPAPAFAIALLALFALFVSPFAARAASSDVAHPFLIVSQTDHAENYASLRALATGADSAPWAAMKTNAINKVRVSEISYNTSAADQDRCARVGEIMSALALAWIIDDTAGAAANRVNYLANFRRFIRYWDRSVAGNVSSHITYANRSDWNKMTPSAAAFFQTVLALDIFYNELTPAERADYETWLQIPADFFNANTTDWVPSGLAARGVWALYTNDTARVTSTKNAYLTDQQQQVTADGVFFEGPGYATARWMNPDREHKHLMGEVFAFTGAYTEAEWYANPRFVAYKEWLHSHARTPFKETWSFGDTSEDPVGSWMRSVRNADRYSATAGRHEQWLRGGLTYEGRIAHYVLMRQKPRPSAAVPGGKIFPSSGASFRQNTGSASDLAAVLVNFVRGAGNRSHMHKEVNSLNLAGHGQHLLGGSGYAGWNSPYGNSSWNYINRRAVSGNTALIDYPAANLERITSIRVTNGGSGYTSAPSVTFTGGGGGGTGLAGTATVSGGRVTGVSVSSFGVGYKTAPTVVFSGGGGSGAAASALYDPATNHQLSEVIVTSPGSGYTSAPSVTISGGGGSGASAVAVLDSQGVVSVRLRNGGNNYTSAPTVSFSGGGGSGAIAVARLGNDHRDTGQYAGDGKYGLGVEGFVTGQVDFASGDSGPALPNGKHLRHFAMVHPQDGARGYWVAFDELSASASSPGLTAHTVWHPNSADVAASGPVGAETSEYRAVIRTGTPSVWLSVFLATPPASTELYFGANAPRRMNRHLYNTYAMDAKRRQVVTVLYPHRRDTATGPENKAAFARLAGPGFTGAVIDSGGGVLDHALESSSPGAVSPQADVAFQGVAALYRRVAGQPVFHLARAARSLRVGANGPGFASDVPVTLYARGAAGRVIAPAAATITFYHPGAFDVKLGDTVLPPLERGAGFTTVAVPAGNHAVAFESASEPLDSLFGTAPAAGAPTLVNPANPENLFANPGFENGLDPAPWVFTNPARATVNSTSPRTGAFAASIVSGSGGVGINRILPLKRGVPYRYRAWALESAANTNSYVTLYGATTPDPSFAFTGTTPTWQRAELTFIVTAGTGATQNVQFLPWFANGSPGGVTFDDFELHELMAPDTSAELGTRFRSESHARATALRVWHPAGGPAAYTLSLWDDTGTRIRQITTPAPAAPGWVAAPLDPPVALAPGRVYTVSFALPAGATYQAGPVSAPAATGPLRPLADSPGVHAAPSGLFPTSPSGTVRYAADLVYEFTEAPPEPAPLDTWRAAHFTAAELADAGLEASLWGELADPDGDGQPNLLEYALAADPRAATADLLAVAITERAIPDQDPDQVLALTFFRARADVDYLVEATSDLLSWELVTTNPGEVGVEVTVADTEPLHALARRFLRLRVVQP